MIAALPVCIMDLESRVLATVEQLDRDCDRYRGCITAYHVTVTVTVTVDPLQGTFLKTDRHYGIDFLDRWQEAECRSWGPSDCFSNNLYGE